MIKGLWGKKIGMTSVFAQDKMVPVTAIDLSNWVVTNIRTQQRDGYEAVQLGCLRKRYVPEQFTSAWIKSPNKYFLVFKEIRFTDKPEQVEVGKSLDWKTILSEGTVVDVSGTTKGCGFAGGMKRHGFSGGPKSHGSNFKRIPGSVSFMRSQGRVIKGKRMAGHMGMASRMMKNLAVVQVMQDVPVILVKGSVPGKAGSLVFVRKA
jgi:large subunit ribosomal protein L3